MWRLQRLQQWLACLAGSQAQPSAPTTYVDLSLARQHPTRVLTLPSSHAPPLPDACSCYNCHNCDTHSSLALLLRSVEFPFDTIKSRFQTDPHLTTYRECIAQLWSKTEVNRVALALVCAPRASFPCAYA